MFTKQPTKSRRGVLLLLILGMLAMIGVLAIAFVILAGQQRKSFEAALRADAYPDPPEKLLNQAAAQVLRDTADPRSVLRSHSLLEDMYGTGATGTVPADIATNVCNGQLIEFTISGVYEKLGCVVTMLDGAAAGKSTRIVGVNQVNGKAQLICFQDAAPASGDTYLINGPAFAGTGTGYRTAAGGDPNTRLDAVDNDSHPYALMPNPVAFDPITGYTDPAGPGGANENYDAPDVQNMLLALMKTDANVPIPSLHRPALINFWLNQLFGDPTIAGVTAWPGGWTDEQKWRAILQPNGRDGKRGGDTDYMPDANDAAKIAKFKRKFILSPLREYHPAFTGSNPSISPDISSWTLTQLGTSNWYVAGPWDVDNDGDGIADSLWMDLGLPVRSTPDGQLYKPLAAILCVDLDGRLNLNAAGSTAQLNASYSTGIASAYAGKDSATATVLPRGSGYGPADMALAPVIASADVSNLLRGASNIEGRYGENSTGTAEAGTIADDAPMSQVAHFEFPYDYTEFASDGLTSFLTPPDLWGRTSLGLDYAGQPLYASFDWTKERVNNPYVAKITDHSARPAATAGTTVDNPFTLAELERVLRQYDLDAAALPSRLWNLATSVQTRRAEVTTDSVDVPGITANLQVPAHVDSSTDRYGDITTMLRKALQTGGASDVDGEMRKMLSWDLMRRMKFDVNRPFGNGRDSDSDSIVDEPDEVASETGWNPPFSAAVSFDPTNGVDADGDGVIYASGNRDPGDLALARQLYARHLFVLMMLLRDAGYVQDAPGETPALTPAQQEELTIRRIAQWAVNVVDFRDADSIMTPFEYDMTPFDGWNVDGDVGTDETTDFPPGNPRHNPNRRVVWGCESPELLLTETTAFHDRRVADTALDAASQAKRNEDGDSDGIPDDDDLDQVMVPQGSAFFELYCPRNRNNPIAPPDLYTYSSGMWYLDLGKLAPANGAGQTYPVWRLAITEKHPSGVNQDSNVAARLAAQPHSASLEPEQFAGDTSSGRFSLLSTSTDPNVQIERIVWFAPLNPTGYIDADRIYYRRGGSALLEPGRYALVGPRDSTPIGSVQGTGADINTLGIPSPHAITLNTVSVKDNDGVVRYPSTSTEIQTPLGMVVAANPPASWTSVPGATIGISVSEPLFSDASYYPPPTATNPNNGGVQEAYGDLAQTGAATFLDPLDGEAGMPLEAMTGTGTQLNFCTAMLQRLANPVAPYDPVTNPYLTVDQMSVDLTVFNGADRKPVDWDVNFPGIPWDPADPTPDTTPEVRLASRQRGTTAAPGTLNLWSPISEEPIDTAAGAVTAPHFKHNLVHTMGYVNSTYGVPWNTNTHVPQAAAAYRGNPFNPSETVELRRPKQFPWLTWNNRPYVSAHELLMVPSSHPARLCLEFSLVNGGDPYDDANPAFGLLGLPFQHLVNFYHSSLTAADKTNPGTGSPHLYRLFDYLDVPSRFVATEAVLNPSVFGNSATDAARLFRPPFNRISTWREPGRININTITSADVWTAVLNGHPGPSFDDVVKSRRGYGSTNDIDEKDWNNPTHMANPFRSGGSADLVPLTQLRRDAVNVTLLRAAGVDADASSTPLFGRTTGEPHNDPDRNAYFRYEPLTRIGNLVTTRSNVYAVWITIGYFQVESAPATMTGMTAAEIDQVYPDGRRLGAELGAETGEIRRHRAFYILDRSIPVGFQRGRDWNVEKAIVLRRFIE